MKKIEVLMLTLYNKKIAELVKKEVPEEKKIDAAIPKPDNRPRLHLVQM